MQGFRTSAIVIGLMGLMFYVACGAKKQVNEGFPPSLEELNATDMEDPFWKLVREKLQISAIEGDTEDQLISNLGQPPSYFFNDEEFAAEIGAQAGAYLATAESSVCAEIQTPLTDLLPTTNALVITNGAAAPLSPLSAKVYMMKYKLKGDTEFRSSILTVPVTPPAGVPMVSVQNETSGTRGYPLIMYAHAGIGGLAYPEIAQSLGLLQSAYIIAAPVFPGEPLCKIYDEGTTTCSGANIASAAVGTSLPYENDATDLLGLHDCIKTFAAGAAKATSTGTEDLGAKILKISAAAQTAFATANPIKAAAAGSPVTITAGLGRGAAVSGLALARAGAYNTVFGGTDAAAITALATKGVRPSMFSCSIMAAPQASFVTGINRLFLDYWVRGTSNALNPQAQGAGELVPGFKAIHAKISAIRANAALSEEQKVDAIAAYAKSIDLVNQTYLMHFGLQNFGKYLTAERTAMADATAAALTLKNAQGAALVMHGIQDKIANITNSELLTKT
ncbi:MAG: hypothetical protein EOP10_14130, partial [Proteobacteria bacterium]